MLKKKISVVFLAILFVSIILFQPHDKTYQVLEVKSSLDFVLDKGNFRISELEAFEPSFSQHNKNLAKRFELTETEAFLLGNLSKYWTEDFMQGRKVSIKKNADLIYMKNSYKNRFLYSGFCVKDGEIFMPKLFERKIRDIRKDKYRVLDLETNTFYLPNDEKVRELDKFLIVKKHQKDSFQKKPKFVVRKPVMSITLGKNAKIYLSDMTENLKPEKNCTDKICKEILANINNSQKSIDMAIYGYSNVPEIEKALKNAIARGVKIRLIYDSDAKGFNIYENTEKLKAILKNNISDVKSPEAGNLMHNKFYIFDEKVLITGSANLSYTDMSGFNSNSIVVINNVDIAKFYKEEFNQMFNGNFHSQKISYAPHNIKTENGEIKIYFSPQDRALEFGVIPLIKLAKKYIYIPTFLLTHQGVVDELIKAKARGVDVKIIIDALNASGKYSKHPLLRAGGVEVKTENYAGKMHSKSMIVDDKYTIIGSMNFSNSGNNRNDENLIVIENPDIARFYKDFFLYQWEKIDEKWLKYDVRAEGKDSIGSCSDGLDNNYDGLIDLADPACR